MPQEYQRIYDSGGGSRDIPVISGAGVFQSISIIGPKPMILATLVAGSTATRASDTATVTATAHGIPSGSFLSGGKIFYPGSPSLVGGWYDNFQYIGANSFTFSAPGSNFSSESVNAGAAYNTLTAIITRNLSVGTVDVGSRVGVSIARVGDSSVNNKIVSVRSDGVNIGTHTLTTSPVLIQEHVAVVNSKVLLTSAGIVGAAGSTPGNPAINLLNPLSIELVGSVAGSGGYLAIYHADIRIIR
jgi:hypothetical protein